MRQPWLLVLGLSVAALLLLWVAWKIGRFLARLALALALVSFVALILWYLLRR